MLGELGVLLLDDPVKLSTSAVVSAATTTMAAIALTSQWLTTD